MAKKEGRGWVNTGAVNVMGRMSGISDRPIDRAIGTSARMARQGNLPFVCFLSSQVLEQVKAFSQRACATSGNRSQLSDTDGAAHFSPHGHLSD